MFSKSRGRPSTPLLCVLALANVLAVWADRVEGRGPAAASANLLSAESTSMAANSGRGWGIPARIFESNTNHRSNQSNSDTDSADAHWWDGFAWGRQGLSHEAHALAVYDGDLIAGGLFVQAGEVPASCVARWDGAAWHPLGQGVDTDCDLGPECWPTVRDLVVWNGNLIVAGHFQLAGGQRLEERNRAAPARHQQAGTAVGVDGLAQRPGHTVGQPLGQSRTVGQLPGHYPGGQIEFRNRHTSSSRRG